MARRSKKSIAEILTPRLLPPLVAQPPSSRNYDNYDLLERKITIATEGFTTVKFCELILENEDPLHKWIGSYNTKLVVLSRFFKWLLLFCSFFMNCSTGKDLEQFEE